MEKPTETNVSPAALPSLGLIIPWYGRLPVYFPLFLQSVARQPLHIFFITAEPKPDFLPDNVQWIDWAFERFVAHIKNALGFMPVIPNAYKICDYKPAYGYLFSELLKPYDFWGTMDIDMIVGDLQTALKKIDLAQLDFLSGLPHYVAGSFFLCRNTPVHNALFMKSRSWKEVFHTPKMVSFTECNRQWAALQKGAYLPDLKTPVESFTEVLIKEREKGLRVLFDNLVFEPKGFEPVQVRDQEVLCKGNSYPILHLLYYKNRQKFQYNLHHTHPPFFINAYGTFRKKPTSLNFIFSVNSWIALYRKIMIQIDKLKKIGGK